MPSSSLWTPAAQPWPVERRASYLKNAGVTSGDKQESEGTNNREWLRVSFNLGTGTAPLDSSTVFSH